MLNPSPSVPYFEVLINGNQRVPQYTPCVQILQNTNSHTIALLNVVYVGKNVAQNKKNSWQYIPEQTPVTINYGMKPYFVYPFLGYVASYKLLRSGADPGYNGLTTTTVQYTITGTSQVMQTTKNVAWKHTSPSTIAATIATQNGFRSVVHSYPSAIQYRLQNTSDFKFLSQLADEIGYRFYIDNTDLYFVNPQLILDRSNIRNIPQFWSYNTPGIWDTIRSFEPIVGTITPDGGIVANRNVIGLNPNTANLVQATSTANVTNASGGVLNVPTITKYYTTAPAESYYEAAQKAAADANNNLYWNTADSDLWGDSHVKPNTLVNLIGNSLPSDEEGLWLVHGVTHTLELPSPNGSHVTSTYMMSTQLERDQIHTAVTTNIAQTAATSQSVPSVLVGGTWKSSNLGASIYAT
jgi:hypothetical protein